MTGPCPHCRIRQGHARTCPTQLVTRDQRIAMVASLSGDYLQVWDIARAVGVPEEEIREGIRVRDEDRRLRALGRIIYGDPAYGAWPARAMEQLRKLMG